MDLLRDALAIVRSGRDAAVATVIRVSGSTPRHPGARMLVLPGGEIRGTIGGGRVESEVTAAGVEVARGGPARRVEHHLVRDLAMCCGGTMELYIEPVAPSAGAIERALALWEQRAPALLISHLGGGPMTVEPLATHPAAIAPALDGDRFVEPIRPRDRLILFGAGHVSRAVAPLAARVGFEVIACDDNETGALEGAFPAARVIESFDLRDVEREIGPLGAGDHVVILTRDHAVDQAILERALASESLSYLGVIGSLGKIGRFRKRLAAKGVATPEAWQRVHGPIGLDIAAETPDEIAVSVVAELISIRNRARFARKPGAS